MGCSEDRAQGLPQGIERGTPQSCCCCDAKRDREDLPDLPQACHRNRSRYDIYDKHRLNHDETEAGYLQTER